MASSMKTRNGQQPKECLTFLFACLLVCLSVCLSDYLRSWLPDYSGLMGKPKVMPVPTTFKITSSDDSQSSMLVVTRNEVQATMTTYFGNDDLFFTSTVTFKNVGDVTITNLICKHSSTDEKESEGRVD